MLPILIWIGLRSSNAKMKRNLKKKKIDIQIKINNIATTSRRMCVFLSRASKTKRRLNLCGLVVRLQRRPLLVRRSHLLREPPLLLVYRNIMMVATGRIPCASRYVMFVELHVRLFIHLKGFIVNTLYSFSAAL